MRKSYPSDITREQYELVREDIENFKKRTHPPDYDLYDILCAILYLVKEGISWRAMPHDFPEWNSVYYHFRAWSKKDSTGQSFLDRILAELVVMERLSHDREPKPTMLITDSKSIQNADTAETKGYDAGKKHQA